MTRSLVVVSTLLLVILSHGHQVSTSTVESLFTNLVPIATSLAVQPTLLYAKATNATFQALGSSIQAAIKSTGWSDRMNKSDDILSAKNLSKDVAAPLRSRYILTSDRVRKIFGRVTDMANEYVEHGDVIVKKSESVVELVKEAGTVVSEVFELFLYIPALDQPTQIDAAFLDFLEKKCISSEKAMDALEAKTDKILITVPGTRAYKRERNRRVCIGIIVGVVLFVVLVLVIGVVVYMRKSKEIHPGSLNMNPPSADAAYMRA